MKIQSSLRPPPVPLVSVPSNQAAVGQEVAPSESPASIHIPEAAVEIPQGLLELSGSGFHKSAVGHGLQAGISGLALLRAVSCFRNSRSFDDQLEGASAAALAVAGGATLMPWAVAGLLSHSALGIHGVAEFTLGLREVRHELSQDRPAPLELTTGLLFMAKGATTFLPMVLPSTAMATTLFHIGVVAFKTAVEPLMDHS